MSDVIQANRNESRLPPIVAILAVFGLLEVLPHHVYGMPRQVSYAVLVVAMLPMIVVTLSTDRAIWLRIERYPVYRPRHIQAGRYRS